jgi:hypothetical protein
MQAGGREPAEALFRPVADGAARNGEAGLCGPISTRRTAATDRKTAPSNPMENPIVATKSPIALRNSVSHLLVWTAPDGIKRARMRSL